MDKRSIGRMGEELARKYFEKRGYTIVDRNFNCRFGEIDLILRKDKAFRFVEVKLRKSINYGLPQESVVKRKQYKIRTVAIFWLRRRHLPIDGELHFDVLAISELGGTVQYEYIEDAF